MIDAPFSGADMVHGLSSLATILFVIGGCLLMAAPLRRYALRALLLGAVAAVLAGVAGTVFR